MELPQETMAGSSLEKFQGDGAPQNTGCQPLLTRWAPKVFWNRLCSPVSRFGLPGTR